jgi:hypothetical protein
VQYLTEEKGKNVLIQENLARKKFTKKYRRSAVVSYLLKE